MSENAPVWTHRLRARLAPWRARWIAFAGSERGRRVLVVARVGFVAALVGYLAWRLTVIGWGEVLRALPSTPWFYALFLLAFVQLPLAETLVYRLLWRFRLADGLGVFLRKRVLNQDVLGYSGEVYLYLWARERAGSRRGAALWHDIRDNNVLSSVASTLVAVGLLVYFVLAGHVDVRTWLGGHTVLEGALVGVLLAVLGAVALRFRRYLFALPLRLAVPIFGVHVVRLLAVNALQVAQWAVVLPEVPLGVWFTFLAATLVIERVPVLPNRDLLFFGVGLELAGRLGVPEAAMAGLLLAAGVLTKGLNLVLFGATLAWVRRRGVPEPGQSAAAPVQTRSAKV